jgi:predicted Zn-dependent protease
MQPPTSTSAPVVNSGYFEHLVEAVAGPAAARALGVDRVALSMRAESSDFLRFNHAQVRQATSVHQAVATLTLVRGGQRLQASLTLGGALDDDLAALRTECRTLAPLLAAVPPDPFLLLPEPNRHSHHESLGRLPAPAELIATLCDAAKGEDLVGFHASGPMVQAFGDSTGSRHWHRSDSFCTEWCLYAAGGPAAPAHLRDKAIKAQYAGREWSGTELTRRVRAGAAQVPLLRLAAKPLAAGVVRAAFSPAAVAELLSTMAWSGFSLRERHHGTSSLSRWAAGDLGPMAAAVTVREATADGIAPRFSEDGFVLPDEVPLILDGQPAGTLNGPRTAREHKLPANTGSDDESPLSMQLGTGSLPHDGLLKALGTGLWVSNLWYLNYSDRPAGRVTGMTRFACFWIENGQAVAPVGAMRFDDSLSRIFGSGLIGLGDRADLLPDTDTYGARQWASITCPGAVVDEFRLTL